MKIIAVPYGHKNAHPINESWFKTLKIKKQVSSLGFTGQWVLNLGPYLSQLVSYINSVFMQKADVYLLTSTGCSPSVILKKNICGSKIITINSDTFFRDLDGSKGIKKSYMLWLLKHIDGMISTSNMMKELAEKYLHGRIPHKVVYPFSETKRFKKINPDYKNSNICTIGTGINTKGTDILIKAFKYYNQEFPSSKLYICGDKDSIKHLKLTKGIIALGNVDPSKYLSKSSIYINSSRHESFGVNILEAMVAGIPPIITKNCGAAEVVKKVDPWLITNLNYKEIAEKAILLQKDTKRKKELGIKCRKIGLEYTQKKSDKTFKESIRDIFKEIR